MTQHIVIVGGGFAGLFAARALKGGDFRVTLLDKHNFHTFQPLLYQVATGALATGDIATPYRQAFRKFPHVTVLMAKAMGIDPARKTVTHEQGEITYDHLFVASGLEHSYFGHDEWQEVSPPLKTLDHALEMRNRIFRAFEQAELTENAEERRKLLTFAVVGAGPTGVELAGQLATLVRYGMKNDFRRVNPADTRVVLVEAGGEVLPAMPPSLREAALRSLEKLGVEVRTGAKVEKITADTLIMRRDGQEDVLETATVLWGAGVKVGGFAAELVNATAAPTDRAGRVTVNADLSVPGHADIFILGDLASIEQDGKFLPGVAPVAIQTGEFAAKLLKARAKGEKDPVFRYKDRGSMAVIGLHHAVGDLGFMRLSGYPAWFIWALVHIMSLIVPEKRFRVFVQWGWKYITRASGDQLITR
ncbi:MAG: NAD(P)/FAD-dependent oxidoreductase [Alphaproteobacteria bacterium]|nr:NAD(P)/FAD-dependent oxidoreductase [Alphaproteobacteria bacterium]